MHQNDATTPNVDFASCIQAICNDEFRGGVAGTSATCLHQVADSSVVFWCDDIIICPHFINVESVGKSKVCDDDVPILI